MNDPLGINSARIGVALQNAYNPLMAQELSRSFGGDGRTMTRQSVSDDFGEVAAIYWQQIIDAKSAFHKAATNHLKGQENG